MQPLRNDESVDENEPVIPKVEIPVIWAGPSRGVVCPPVVGAYCDLECYDGDPDYPRISNFRWHSNKAPNCELEAFIIQKDPGVYIKIDHDNNILNVTTGNLQSEIGVDLSESVGGAWTINVDGSASIHASSIDLTGDTSIDGSLHVSGDISAGGSITDTSGNTNHHSH